MSGPQALPSPERKRVFVREMFDRIAPRYDLMNRVMTLGLDRGWRRSLLDALRIGPGDVVVDLGTGTGDLARQSRARGARSIGVDLAMGMLRCGRARPPRVEWVQSDGTALPFSSGSVTAVTCGFALRNFADLDAVLAECARILIEGGRLGILEVHEPWSPLLRLGYGLHFRWVVPRLGALLSERAAYEYLPASASYLPDEDELRDRLEAAGFASIEKRTHLFGACQRVMARRPGGVDA